MKRYIRSSDSVSLSDIISKISYFVIVDDCTECDLSMINASDDVDNDPIEYLLSIPDPVFADLDKEDLVDIEDVGVLDRAAKLCKHNLSSKQLNILRKEYSKKFSLDESAKLELLNLFKSCNKVTIENRSKNNDFLAEYDLSKADVLNILHSLKLSDFDSKTRSINYSHLGDNLIVLHPNILIPNGDIIVGANLYVKLDVDESKHSAAAFVSIHPRKYD